ncbi:hypothetical protein GQ53DRAFT_631306 [Thozetella sp. PMI_491]|nr:hypothetical protein GQ53DRAFT_631306 [Thozetella sp. PMI_491]
MSLPPGFDPVAIGSAGLQAGVIPFFPFFTPSFDLSFVAAVIFTVIGVIHVLFMFKSKAWYFSIGTQAAAFLGIGSILKAVLIGLVGAGPSASLFGTFSAFQLMFMITNSILPLSVIFTYTRLMWWITPPEIRNFTTLWAPPMYHSFFFGLGQTIGDIFSMIGNGQFVKPVRPRLVAIGAVFQMLVWMYLFVVVTRFTWMSRSWRREKEMKMKSQKLGIALSICSFLLSVRGLMLVLEKDAQDSLLTTFKVSSIVTTDEWTLYVFDTLPQALILIILAIHHPGFYLPKRLLGFRLKTQALAKEKKARPGSPASNGWIISSPTPIDMEKATTSSTYLEVMGADMYKTVGYAK